MVNTAILVSTAKARKAELAAEIDTIDKFIALFDKTAAVAEPKKLSGSERMKKAWAKRRRNAAKAKAAGASLAEAAA